MSRKNPWWSICVVLLMVMFIAGCSSQSAPAPKPQQPAAQKNEGQPQQPKFVAKLGHVGAPDHVFEIGAKKFSELVLQKTNGQIRIDTYPGGQLGGDRDMFEGLQMGTIEFAIEGPIDSFLPITSVVNLAYLFNGPEHVYKFLDGPLGEQVFGGLEKMGIHHLAEMENGWRLVTSNKPINSIADLKGMKIRVPESPVFRDAFTALGASPVPVAFTELYSALQQGVVDGQENPIFHIMTQRFYEVQKYVALTRHIYMNAPLLVSLKFWQQLTPEQQKAIEEAAMEATQYQRQVCQQKEKELLKELETKGVTITKPDLAPFREAVKPVHEAWAKQFGQDLYQQIVALGQ
ncbi:MAG TPA: DctP family TRAP transporter solute-binding subunit [Firmicutes bacterium]|nr:DctP family TRAP transporter solute-binding subunit [Bacillota bacterium]